MKAKNATPARKTTGTDLEARCHEFNKTHPVGIGVKYHSVIGEEAGRFTTTRSEAYVLNGHTAVIFVNGVSGCVWTQSRCSEIGAACHE